MHRNRTMEADIRTLVRDPGALVAAALAAVALVAVASLSPAFAQGSAPATVATATSDEYGSYLADPDGHALYLFVQEKEGDSGGEGDEAPMTMTSGVRDASPACQDACASVWPAFTAGNVAAGAGVDASMLYTAEVQGRTQVVYDGWPLYTFAGDNEAGDTNGEGIEPPDGSAFGGSWYLVAPDGSAIEGEETGAEGGDG